MKRASEKGTTESSRDRIMPGALRRGPSVCQDLAVPLGRGHVPGFPTESVPELL